MGSLPKPIHRMVTLGPARECDGDHSIAELALSSAESRSGGEQIAILAIPVALKALLRVVLPLQPQELGELGIGRRHLGAVRPAVVGEIEAAAVLEAAVDQAAKIGRRL